MLFENTLLRRIATSLCFSLSIVAFHSSLAQGTWTPLTNLAPNRNYGVMLLLTDGSVLVKSDSDSHGSACTCAADPGDTWNKLTPDSHGSYINGTWTTMAHMSDERVYFASQVMQDGRVYVAGGEYGTGWNTAEVYNPLTDIWTPAVTIPTDTIMDGNSQILPDGRILQAIAYNPDTHTCIYDPATNAFTPGPDVLGIHSESVWLLLPDNSILFADRIGNTTERYIPATNTWIADTPTPLHLFDQGSYETGSAQLLPDGRGVFFGGSGNVLYYTPTGTTAPGSWSIGPHMAPGKGAPDAPSATMPNGKILCTVSDSNTAAVYFPGPTYFYEFDYLASAWTPISAPVGGDTITGPAANTNMLTLPDGSILLSVNGSRQYYVYTPAGAALAAGKPTVDTVIKISCTKYMATGKLFNGISQGACYNDEWQNPTNYPLVRLTSGTNVYYARTYKWNSVGVQRGTRPDTTYFDLPSALPGGSYSLQVVANGNPSASRAFYTCGVNDVPATAAPFNKIRITPNPTANHVTIQFYAGEGGPCTTRLADITGRTVLQQTGTTAPGENTLTLNLAQLPKGIYTVSVTTNEDVTIGKVVRE